MFLSRRFHRPICFLFEFISNSDPHRNLINQLQSQARTNVDLWKWCGHFHVWPHCLILTEACSCRLELADFAGKISKNRLVCKNAVALAYFESCRLLVMGSWQYIAHESPRVPMHTWNYVELRHEEFTANYLQVNATKSQAMTLGKSQYPYNIFNCWQVHRNWTNSHDCSH